MSMKKIAVLAKMMVLLLFVCAMVSPSWAGIKMDLGEHTNLEVGIWGQTWFQYVEDGAKSGTSNSGLKDFSIRRAYLYLKGDATEHLSFFTHLASDKVGKHGTDDPSVGLGSGVAWRDLWITLNLDKALMIQMGRMYVPLTRNYGTTSTKSMMTVDLPFLQGGSQGDIFYATKVGRDDGLAIWGNPLDGLLQYRLMINEGAEGDAINPGDNLRYVGRVSVSLLEPEKGWFNKGTYLGKKKVLSIGFGAETQSNLTLRNRAKQNNLDWTTDVFFDHPIGGGAVTVEAAYIHIENSTVNHHDQFTTLDQGDDARNWYVNAGYLLPGSFGPGHLQPYCRYETVYVDERPGKNVLTDFWSGGLNYYLKGHNAKITADYMYIDQDRADRSPTQGRTDRGIFTFQMAVGF
jgi:hypothetical protein